MRNPIPRSTLRRHAPAVFTALVGGLLYLFWDPPTKDLANQHLRSAIFAESPFAPWNNMWFSGHHTPGYSLLAPPLGAFLGPEVLGVMATIACAAVGSVLLHRLAVREPSLRDPGWASVMLAIGFLASLFGGRTAFLLGGAFGLGAVLVAIDNRRVFAALLALLATAASPVAGLFVALCGTAMWLSRTVRRSVAAQLIVPPAALTAVLTVLFPDSGTFQLPLGLLVNSLAATALVAVACRRFLTLRWACAGAALLYVLVAVVSNPIGGNATRLVATVAPAIMVLSPLTARRVVTVAVLVPLMLLQWSPVSLAITGDRDQMQDSFYDPVMEVLAAQPQPLRVEVVPVVTHSEASAVGRHFPIARGWHRQFDRHHNALFYGELLLASDYQAWLVENGVSIVAIADTELDYAGRLEEELLRQPPSYLRLLYQDDVWRVFEVLPRPPLSSDGGVVTSIDSTSFELSATEGEVDVRVRFSPWMQVVSGDACIRRGVDGWATVVVSGAGRIRVEASLTLRALVDRDGDC